jgi:translocation and assembly module TamA
MKKEIFTFVVATTFVLAAQSDKTKEYELIIDTSKAIDRDKIAEVLGAEDEGFFSSKKLLKEEFVKIIEPSIKGYLENQGYFDSTIDIKKSEDSIEVAIVENEPIRVTDIDISTNIDLKKIINWKKGDIFAPERFNNIKDEIVTKLLEDGYCQYKLKSKAYVDLKKHSAKLLYNIDKNRVCYFGDITISNKPKDIKKRVVLSRIKYKKGDRFSLKAIKESYNDLNRLNTFANIKIAYDLETNSTTIDSDISLDKRSKLRRYSVAIGADSVLGARVKGLWEKRDFLGNAKKFTIESELSKSVQSIKAKLFAPALISINKNYFDFYISSGYRRERADGYNERKFFVDGYLDYNYKEWNIKAGLGLENLQIDLKDNIPGIIGGTFNLLYPYTKITYDGRDSKLDPKNGLYASAYFEYGISPNNNGVQYLKYLLEGRAIKSFDDLTLSAVLKVGAIHEVSGRLPASKLFYGGGLFSNRAYSRNKIGIITSKSSYESLGGKSFVNLQLEANYKIYKKIYGALFFDSTIINKEEYKLHGNRIDTIGFGIRYKTPIGPVKLDVGFNLHNRKDYAISVMLGQSF